MRYKQFKFGCDQSVTKGTIIWEQSNLFFGGNSHPSNSTFKIQKRIIRIITNTGSRDSCRQLFRQLQILSLPSQYVFTLLVFVNKNRGLFQSNSEIHDLNTRFNHNLHLPSTNSTLVQKGVLYSGSKIYNYLPSNIKVLSNDTKFFKTTLKSYLTDHTFYSLDEFLSVSILMTMVLCFFIWLLIAIRSHLTFRRLMSTIVDVPHR